MPIVAASKYQAVPAARERAAAPAPVATSTIIERAVRVLSSKRTAAYRAKFPNVFIPTLPALLGWRDWATRHLQPGGLIERLLDWEKRTSPARFRSVAKARRHYQHNPKSETRLVASIPAPEFFRARQVDKDFWADHTNVKNYKRDNPDAFIRL